MINAAVSVEARKTELREFSEPQLAAGSGLLKVELSGVCGSDWPYYLKYPSTKGPLILGHEGVGLIDKLSTGAAKRFGFKEGDRVALEEYLPCGHCAIHQSASRDLAAQQQARRPIEIVAIPDYP